MNRPRYTFRPNPLLGSHLQAWDYLLSVPEGQRNDFLVRAILRMQEETVLEETLRRVLREELRNLSYVPAAQESHSTEPDHEPSIPQGMMDFLNGLMDGE